jgi:integrase/recombinase XerD
MCSPVLAGKYLDQIDRRLIAMSVSHRKATGVSDTTIRRDLAYLSSLCTSTVAWGWLDTNPVTSFNKRTLKESRPRTRFLDSQEYAALLSAASDRLRPPSSWPWRPAFEKRSYSA